MGGVGLWHDNHTTLSPILQAEIGKNSVGRNFKMGRVWQYPSLCWLVKRYKILTNHEALKEEMLVEVKNLKTQICHYKMVKKHMS